MTGKITLDCTDVGVGVSISVKNGSRMDIYFVVQALLEGFDMSIEEVNAIHTMYGSFKSITQGNSEERKTKSKEESSGIDFAGLLKSVIDSMDVGGSEK